MNKEITFKCDKNGVKRAYYLRRTSFRWFSMPTAKAELLIATGQARFVPLTKCAIKVGK